MNVLLLIIVFVGNLSAHYGTIKIVSIDTQAEPIMHNHDLVNITEFMPDIVIDIKYATTDNFTGKILYNTPKCYLRREAAYALQKVHNELKETCGYRLKIWDAYRPHSVQYLLWEIVHDPRYVANPQEGSRHNRGCAIDLTLIDQTGAELPMGTEFDDFTIKAHRTYKNLPQHILENRQLLENIMHKHGFIGLETEWWHFDYHNWRKYDLLDIPFEAIENIEKSS